MMYAHVLGHTLSLFTLFDKDTFLLYRYYMAKPTIRIRHFLQQQKNIFYLCTCTMYTFTAQPVHSENQVQIKEFQTPIWHNLSSLKLYLLHIWTKWWTESCLNLFKLTA